MKTKVTPHTHSCGPNLLGSEPQQEYLNHVRAICRLLPCEIGVFARRHLHPSPCARLPGANELDKLQVFFRWLQPRIDQLTRGLRV